MKIIKPRQHHEEVKYTLEFEWADGYGGFSFPCNEKGEVDESQLQPAAIKNLQACKAGEMSYKDGPRNRDGNFIGKIDIVTQKIISKGILTWRNRHIEPAIGECNVCGTEVSLDGFTNTCSKCDTDYNMSGQQLAPRQQWGEETGESLSDILGVDSASNDDLLD